MVSSITPYASASETQSQSKTQAPEAQSMASKETFLQLLVAQIKNQNPLNPADGVQFLTQLAQFSELEQLISMGDDLGAIKESLTAEPDSEQPPAA
jgi:flagellar basal-body rod modification protein FlgD